MSTPDDPGSGVRSQVVPERSLDVTATEPLPGPGLVTPHQVSVERHYHWVRLFLALGMLAVIWLLAGMLASGWHAGRSTDDLQALVGAYSPLTTLAGVVFTFYFTSRKQ